MYFSDAIQLIARTYPEQDALAQHVPQESSRTVYCDLTSISGTEQAAAGQQKIRPYARARVHAEDYAGETLIEYAGGGMLRAGRYAVYRTYYDGDVVELYLEAKTGVRGGEKCPS